MATNPYAAIERTRKPGQIGWQVNFFPEISSTQDKAEEIAAAGCAEGAVVIADAQSAGRGRLGRRWHSPPGANLYMTIVLRPKMPMTEVPRLSLLAGVAAAEAIDTLAPGLVALKWPNDVWLRGKKAGGIIAQAITDSGAEPQCVLVGIGINVNLRREELPADLRKTATSLRIETGKEWDRTKVADALFSKLDTRYTEMGSAGFGAIRPQWEKYSALTGHRVTVIDGDSRQSGVVKGIDADGALLLDIGTRVARIMVGDVTLEGAYD
jgi:BirA family biotin operon repressor/biotin-[acetyl-CoA-carboxylase] ligase